MLNLKIFHSLETCDTLMHNTLMTKLEVKDLLNQLILITVLQVITVLEN